MTPRKSSGSRKREKPTRKGKGKRTIQVKAHDAPHAPELVIITGMSGSGKLTALKAFEDLGFYAVDNLPIALVPKFADLTRDSKTRRRAALIRSAPKALC